MFFYFLVLFSSSLWTACSVYLMNGPWHLLYLLVNCYKVPRSHGIRCCGGGWLILTLWCPLKCLLNVIKYVKRATRDAVELFRLAGTDQIWIYGEFYYSRIPNFVEESHDRWNYPQQLFRPKKPSQSGCSGTQWSRGRSVGNHAGFPPKRRLRLRLLLLGQSFQRIHEREAKHMTEISA